MAKAVLGAALLLSLLGDVLGLRIDGDTDRSRQPRKTDAPQPDWWQKLRKPYKARRFATPERKAELKAMELEEERKAQEKEEQAEKRREERKRKQEEEHNQLQQMWQERRQRLELEQQAEARETCSSMAAIRIQNTAGSAMTEVIMPQMTKKNNQTQLDDKHLEYNQAMALAPECTVTSLRSPVERFVSEYSLLSGPEGPYAVEQDQWDFHGQDLEWARRARLNPNASQSFWEFLSSPASPSRNRQALYLLGFERVQCQEGRCCGVCAKGAGGYPARAYDWSADHDELLARAKQNLLKLRAFAVQDCFVESMKAVAKAVGWDPAETAEMADKSHARVRRNAPVLTMLKTNLGGTGELQLAQAEPDAAQDVPWAAALPRGWAEEIRKLNAVDEELVKFAKWLLYDRHGIKCGSN